MLKCLCLFLISLNCFGQFKFPSNFLWGVSNSAAQVENSSDDLWLDWREKGVIPKSDDDGVASTRINFFDDYMTELNLASSLGVNTFRMSLSWERLVPNIRPLRVGDKELFDKKAVQGYRKILKEIKARNMKVVLTLFHHDIPRWGYELGDWNSDQVKTEFDRFARAAFYAFDDLVDYWNTFNEPNIYLLVTQTTGLWPYKPKASLFNLFKLSDAKMRMISSHKKFYSFVKKKNPYSQIGLTNNVANYQGRFFPITLFAEYFESIYNYSFFDQIQKESDFIGINYYGVEHIGFSMQAYFQDKTEYSDSGRGIDPEGLYHILKILRDRYGKPVFITENGIADNQDVIRPSYLYEHLLATHQAMKEGVDILGYIHWTLSDNWELGDGYCPRFGLVGVKRSKGLKRTPRLSFFEYKKIIIQNGFSSEDRNYAWQRYRSYWGKARTICKTVSPRGERREESYKSIDWGFGL